MLSSAVLRGLQAIVGPEHVLYLPEDLLVFEYDGYLEVAAPEVVVQPASAEEVAAAVRLAAREGLAVVARGAATGLSGGAIAVRGGLMVDLNRLAGLREIRLEDRLARVEPGLVNSELTAAVAGEGFFYAPDPSSQRASTLGGNIGENAGGPHCLAHGMTTNSVVGLGLVTGAGERYEIGGPAPDTPGYDLVGLIVGSEGTLGIVTGAWVRLLPVPQTTVTFLALFDRLELAASAVSDMLTRRVIPAALELIDQPTARALEQAFGAGYPEDVDGVVLIDLDGLVENVVEAGKIVEEACRDAGCVELRRAETSAERDALWAARKGALAALARIAPNYYLHDMVVPRSRLAAVLRDVVSVAEEHGVTVANVAHAGDGNLHPTILFDLREPAILPRIIAAGEAMLRLGVAAGGSISGEHGIGLEKMEYMAWLFSEADLAVMQRVRSAFSPIERFNPGKVFPQGQPREARVKVWSSAAVGPDTWI